MGKVTPEVVQQWIEMHPTTGLAEMVRVTGFSTGSIRRHLAAAGVPPKPLAWRKSRKSDRDRFLEKIRKDDASGCWIWTSTKVNTGYGTFYLKKGQWESKDRTGWGSVLAHRYSYELAKGPIPEGLSLDHLCRTPACVNPAHLEPVTHGENVRRGVCSDPNRHPSAIKNRAKTHCPRGHSYDDANTYTNSRGQRSCKICKNASTAAAKRRRADHGKPN